jgi:pimeloyl-ACP methyl ester carboxylesterase
MSALAAFALVIVGALAAVFAAIALWARSHPLEAFVKMTRRTLVRAGLTRRELRVNGSRIVYFSGGRGSRPLVLVHGVNDQAGSWSGVIAKLRDRFRIVAVDLAGHGESEPSAGPLAMQVMIDGLGAVIDRESPDDPVILVGNSMGGWVSMLYAVEHPGRVAQLVLEDSSGLTWDISHVPAFPKDREEALRLLRMVHGPTAPIPGFLVDAMLKLAPTLPQARVLAAGVDRWAIDTRLPELKMPVTLIWGAHDGLLSLEYARTLQGRIAGSRLHVIEHAAHSPHRQTAAEFAQVLLEATA